MTEPRQIMTHKLDVFNFGKFKGKTVRFVIERQASYILWLNEEGIVKFSQEIYDNACDEDANQGPPEVWILRND